MPSPGQNAEDYWVPGTWNIICSICGTKLKFSEAVQNWQGMWRHPKCDEPRHPQDFVHAINSQEMAIPFPQKETTIDVIAPVFPASGAIVTNTFTTAVNVAIFPQGVIVSQVKVNGIAIGLGPDPGDEIHTSVPAGQTIQITYSRRGYPTWAWY